MANNDSDSFQRQLQALQQEYDNLLPGRLREIGELLDEVGRTGQGQPPLARLHRAVHSLAGSGTTFGYRALSATARDIERLVKTWLDESHLPSKVERLRAEALVKALATAVSGSDGMPAAPIFHPAVAPERPAEEAADSQPLLYVAEDDGHLAAELSLHLRHFGYRVQVFGNATDTAAAVAGQAPDALLMDMVLPEGDLAGAEMLQRLQDNTGQSFPVAFMSVRNDFSARLAAVRAGARAYLVKPLDPDLLVEQLDRLMRRRAEPKYRVLLVDDDASLVRRHALVLSGAGMQVRTIQHPEQALDALAELDPDLILLDLYMPGCSGLELTAVIRQHERYLHIPIVYLSTEFEIEKQFDALRMGGDEFLTKPVSDERLLDAVVTRASRARRLNELMTQDSLTGLLKHTRTKELLGAEIVRQQRVNGRLAFAMVDIDHFKEINDRHGHPAGDRVIKNLAHMLKNRSRKCDLVGRYGGEEFALVLPDCTEQDAVRILDQLREHFARVYHSLGQEALQATFSAGVAGWQTRGSAEQLIDQADKALYRAKEQGRNQVVAAG